MVNNDVEAPFCPICGTNGARIRPELAERWMVPQPGQIWDCLTCHLRSVWPQPTFQDNHERFEDEKYYIDVVGTKRIHFRKRAAYIRSIVMPNQTRFLDVGCGRGEMVLEAQAAGFQAAGIELSQYAAAFGRDNYHLSISNTRVEEVPANSYDIIHSSHVLEHVHSPVEFACHLKRILAPQGICVLEVPNEFMNLMARLNDFIGRPRTRLLPSIHLFYFDPTSLRRVMETAGFKTHRIFTYSHPVKSSSASLVSRVDAGLRNLLRKLADVTQRGDNIVYVGR
jgi:2-polyprenyl-3-methyl-5-hydroxy-6-metoxy-1,4-benzoquinol methylase